MICNDASLQSGWRRGIFPIKSNDANLLLPFRVGQGFEEIESIAQ